jgi:serine/threonine protein kinase
VSSDPTGEASAFPAAIASGFTVGAHVAGYRLEQMIGRGGMAMVFRAADERLGRQVALKILAPSLAADTAFRQRFVGESRMAAAVDDPHIIPVHEAGEAGGVLFIAMRYVPGGDVRTMLQRFGPMSGARAAAIISPVASALDAAHAVGLIHRDVKPANMLLDSRTGRPDHVYLSDFGLGKEAVSAAGLTQSGQILGTPAYSSPEQVEGKPLDGRADEYSLACAAFEMLTGAPPFVQTQITALILAQLSSPPPTLTSRRPDLPAAADPVFAKALAKNREDRYASCREFAEHLRQAFGLVPYDSGPDIVPPGYIPTEVASPGEIDTNELTKDVPSGDTSAEGDVDARTPTGDGQGLTVDRTTPPLRDSAPQPRVPPEETPVPPAGEYPEVPARRPSAAVAASCLVGLAALAEIGALILPGPVTGGGAIFIVTYVIATVLAGGLLVGKRWVTVAAILLGMWAPALGFLAADVAAIGIDHSLDYTGGALANFYVSVMSDVLGVAGLVVLWSVWRSNRTAGPPGSRGGVPAALVCNAALIGVALAVIDVSFGSQASYNYSAYDYSFGAGALVVAVVVALIAISVRQRVLGGAMLLGWAAIMTAIPLNLLTTISRDPGLAKVTIILMLLLLAPFVVLTVAYMNIRPRQAAEPVGERVAPGGR